MLARRLDRISEQHRWSRDFTASSLHLALGEVIACFPVYRTYAQADTISISDGDRLHVLRAVREAKRRNRTTSESIFDFLCDLLLLRDPEGLSETEHAERRELVMRLQQLTGPVMAKGLEDTVFYRYYPLASLNEVGGRPTTGPTELERFHVFCARRWREVAARALRHRHPRHQAGRGHAGPARRPLRDPARVDGDRQALAADEPPRQAAWSTRRASPAPTRSTCSTRRCSASGRSRRSSASCRRRSTARSRSGWAPI